MTKEEIRGLFEELDMAREDNTLSEYEKFLWYRDWFEYQETLPELEGRQFQMAIVLYGFYGKRSEKLKGEAAEYFDKNVIPELDRQHELLSRGEEIREINLKDNRYGKEI